MAGNKEDLDMPTTVEDLIDLVEDLQDRVKDLEEANNEQTN